MVKNKNILKEIAKRYAAAILNCSEAIVAFEETGLSVEECFYIDECLHNIASRLTNKDIISDVFRLVNEYYE